MITMFTILYQSYYAFWVQLCLLEAVSLTKRIIILEIIIFLILLMIHLNCFNLNT